jgi:hypothetical protein
MFPLPEDVPSELSGEPGPMAHTSVIEPVPDRHWNVVFRGFLEPQMPDGHEVGVFSMLKISVAVNDEPYPPLSIDCLVLKPLGSLTVTQ